MVNSKIDLKELVDYKLIVDHLPINIFIVNETGHIYWANKKLLALLNISLTRFQGSHVNLFGQNIWDNYQETLINKSETTMEEEYNGIHFLTTRKPLIKEDKVIGVLGISIDITAQKLAEKAKAEFLRSVRHDIRTPITGIIGAGQLLKASVQSVETHDLADTVIVSSETFIHLLDKIFTFIEFFPGGSKKEQAFSLKTTLEGVLNLHLSKSATKGLPLLFEYDPGFPEMIIAKEMSIQRLTWELLSNALKYTHQGHIKIIVQHANSPGKHILALSVEDTGIGIAPENHKAIFEPLTRISSSWTKEETGQGLGLSNVQKLLQELDAEIQLTSTLGKGSRFTCLIPFQPLN